MITHTWCERLDDGDVAEASTLVAEAARYDEEAGFTAIEPREVLPESAGPDEVVWHLPIKARRDLSTRDDAPVVMVAYLRLSIDRHGQGTVAMVVHPRYRSRGISTTLVEELGLDVSASGGWCGTGARSLRGWAYGSHPASERLARRFGVAPVARLWTVLRHLSGPFALPLAAAEVPDSAVIVELPDLADPGVAARVREVVERADLAHSHVEQFVAECAGATGRVLMASDLSGRDLGFVWFDPRLREHMELRTASVRALMLAADARGAGLGVALLTRALGRLADGGAQLARMRVDPEDEGAVRMLRLLSFEQEEAHACYQVGAWIDPPVYRRE
ncbi:MULTISPECIES: GNAT family N-acetyltransferase [Nocardia]|uniref:GNAT family N-acetyltransferase n=1 Tax=Nocardia TaxID=1817 RepID=UPI000D69700F|nr:MULTISPECIES: GNAT family N-acetyltransferase [Nocardia]